MGLLCLSMGLVIPAQAQTTQNQNTSAQGKTKVTVPNTKQVGLKDTSKGSTQKTSSMSLNPSLFQKQDPKNLLLDNDANLDYRVMQGCLQRSLTEENLPSSIGIDNLQFAEFFKN